MPNSSIKNEKMYQDLRKKGDSKEKAARISNAAAARGKSAVGAEGRQVRFLRRLDGAATEEAGQRAWHVRIFRPDERQVDRQTAQSLSRDGASSV